MSNAKSLNAVAEADLEQNTAPKAARTWIITLGISFAMLAIMYGLAFWHEARAEAARSMPPAAAVTAPAQ